MKMRLNFRLEKKTMQTCEKKTYTEHRKKNHLQEWQTVRFLIRANKKKKKMIATKQSKAEEEAFCMFCNSAVFRFFLYARTNHENFPTAMILKKRSTKQFVKFELAFFEVFV